MNTDELNLIESRLNAITPGKWVEDSGGHEVYVDHPLNSIVDWIYENADGHFIANAPNDIRVLIAEVRRLQKAIETAEFELGTFVDGKQNAL